MRKGLQGVLILFFVVSFVGAFSVQAKAAGPRDGEIVDGSLLTSGGYVEARVDKRTRTAVLACGAAYLLDELNGNVYMCGQTYAFEDVNRLRTFVYLEKLHGGTWETVNSSIGQLENSLWMEHGVDRTVEQNKYYRLKTVHYVMLNGYTETLTIETDGLYVG